MLNAIKTLWTSVHAVIVAFPLSRTPDFIEMKTELALFGGVLSATDPRQFNSVMKRNEASLLFFHLLE